jgi:hypothetical protein
MWSDKHGKLKYKVIIYPNDEHRFGYNLKIYINPGESIYEAVCKKIYDDDGETRPDVIKFNLKLRHSPRVFKNAVNTLISLDELAPYSDDNERYVIDFHWLK